MSKTTSGLDQLVKTSSGSNTAQITSLQLNSGTESLPSLYFDNTTTSGIYKDTDDGIAVSVGSSKRLKVSSDTTVVSNNLQVSGIVTVAPVSDDDQVFTIKDAGGTAVFYVDTNGSNADRVVIRSSGANSQAFGVYNTNNSTAFKVSSGGAGAGQVLCADGTAALPSHSFDSDPNTGLFSSGADEISISCGGTTVAKFSQSGLTMGTTIGTAIADIAIGDGAVELESGGLSLTYFYTKWLSVSENFIQLGWKNASSASTGLTLDSNWNATGLPAAIRPSAEVKAAITVVDGSTVYPGYILIGTDGRVRVYANGTNVRTGTVEFYGGGVSYSY